MARSPGRISAGSTPRMTWVAKGAAAAIRLVDPHLGPEVAREAIGVGHVVAVGEEDVGQAAPPLDLADQRRRKRGESTSRLPSGRTARNAFAPKECSELNPQ